MFLCSIYKIRDTWKTGSKSQYPFKKQAGNIFFINSAASYLGSQPRGAPAIIYEGDNMTDLNKKPWADESNLGVCADPPRLFEVTAGVLAKPHASLNRIMYRSYSESLSGKTTLDEPKTMLRKGLMLPFPASSRKPGLCQKPFTGNDNSDRLWSSWREWNSLK